MRKLLTVLAALAAAPASANDFPTAARVEYVLACMAGEQSYTTVNACSCRIDVMASRFTYEDWTAIETAVALQSVPGRRASAIRGIGWIKDLLERFRAAEADAEMQCR
jgi:hypothetical protein